MGFRGEGGGAADVEDALRIGLGFEEAEGRAGLLLGGKGRGGVGGEDGSREVAEAGED